MQAIRKSLFAVATASVILVPAAAFSDVKLGFLGGFTGPIESLVPPIAEGAKLAAKHVNDAGGSAAGNISVVVGDTTCADATKAADAADRLVNSEKVVAIVGALCSGATISSANNAAIPGNVVMISPASTSPAISGLDDNDLLFRTTPSDAYQGEVLASLLKSKNIGSIAISYVNNDYGKGFASALASAFEAKGGKVAASEAHEDGKADYRAEVGSLESSGAELLVLLAYADGSGQTVLRQALESGTFTQFAGGDGMAADSLLAAVDPAAIEGMILTRPGTPEIPGAASFATIAKAASLDPNGVFVAQSYDAAFLLALAIEKNGSGDRAGVSKALRAVASAPGEVVLPGEWAKAKAAIAAGKDVNYEGATGSHEFDKSGDVAGVILEMTVKGGKLVDVGLVK